MEHKTYKQLTEELQQAMEDLESGDLDIDEAVKVYEKGLKIVKQLEEYLREAENRVIELKAQTPGDGNGDSE